ncbi:MAG: hypothetical protein WD069_04480 [Planctomycetales bacterium]
MPIRIRVALSAAILLLIAASAARAESPAKSLAAIRAVGPRGEGHAAAVAAVKELQRSDAAALLPILRAFRDANPLAANWLTGAFESIAGRALKSGGALPVAELETFLENRDQSPAARELAYRWVARVDATVRERLVPDMLDDPSPELRREAVALFIDRAERFESEKRPADALAAWKRALSGAVHVDQVKRIVQALEPHGEEVHLPRHFGFITEWRIVGPFDHAGDKGFDAVYPPEQELDFAKEYAGKTGNVAWREIATDHDYGLLDIAKSIAPYKGAAMYAVAEFHADAARDAEIRLGTPNAWKLWVNGRLLFSREEYHRGMAIDQYRVPVRLQSGANTILLKICQNEQSEDWAQSYEFQLRVCERSGTGLRSVAGERSASAETR